MTLGPQPRVPNHMHMANSASGATFVLNSLSGHWHVMNPSAAELWQELWLTGDPDQAIHAVANRSRQPTSDTFRADAERTIADFAEQGLTTTRKITTGVPNHLVSARGKPVGYASSGRTTPNVRETLLAHIGFMMTLCLLRLPFHLTLRIAVALTRTWCARPATRSEALATVAAIDIVADKYPGRAACLERSLGSVVTAALTRRRLTWVIGIADDPCRFHAWVENDGIVVARSPESHFDTFNRALST